MSTIANRPTVLAQVFPREPEPMPSRERRAPNGMEQYRSNVEKWMGELRQVVGEGKRQFASKGTTPGILGSALAMVDWIQEPAGANPPRKGNTLFDLATRVGTVPANQVDGLLKDRPLPSGMNARDRQVRANIQAHWNGRPGTGPSAETRLAMAISRSPGNVTPAQLMRMSLQANNGDYTMALLTAHNLLKNMTSSTRNGPGSQDQLTWNGKKMTLQQRDAQLANKLQGLRPPGDNKSSLDIWYHTFAIGLADLRGGPVAAGLAASLESNQSHLDGDCDQAEDYMNQQAARTFGVNMPGGGMLTDFFDFRTGAQCPR
jgi:hypothetical protein